MSSRNRHAMNKLPRMQDSATENYCRKILI